VKASWEAILSVIVDGLGELRIQKGGVEELMARQVSKW
jgi:hypothetical protein